MTEEQMAIFDGLMISDASLEKSKRNKNARFRMGVKMKSFAEVPQKLLTDLPFGEMKPYNRFDKRTGKTYSGYACRSLVHPFFTEQRLRWYPEGKKIAPHDIDITKSLLLWWYIGDGHLYRKKDRPNYRRVQLCTQGFTTKDVMFLIDKLKGFLSINSIYIENNGICIGKNALCKLANMLGLYSPLPDYQYKFEFGRYIDEKYFTKSYNNRPLHKINAYRKKHRVRELDYKSVKAEFQGAMS